MRHPQEDCDGRNLINRMTTFFFFFLLLAGLILLLLMLLMTSFIRSGRRVGWTRLQGGLVPQPKLLNDDGPGPQTPKKNNTAAARCADVY